MLHVQLPRHVSKHSLLLGLPQWQHMLHVHMRWRLLPKHALLLGLQRHRRAVLHVHMRRHVPKHAVLKPIQLAVLRLPWHRRAVLHVHVREYLPKHTVRNGPVEHTVQRLQRQRRAVLHVPVRKYVSKHAVLKPIQLAVLWLPWAGMGSATPTHVAPRARTRLARQHQPGPSGPAPAAWALMDFAMRSRAAKAANQPLATHRRRRHSLPCRLQLQVQR